MKKFFSGFFLFMLISFFSYGQTGFRPGFIITNELDTIKGQVAYLDESILLRSCQFIAEGVSTAATYTPGEIFGYGFTGDKFFVSKEVTVFTPAHVRRSPHGDQQIPESTVNEMVFLEFIVQGAANLYKHSPTVFFAEKNGEFYQLYIEERVIEWSPGLRGHQYAQDFKRYVGVLQMIMHDCPGFGTQINEVSFNEGPLSELFVEYSKCREVAPVFFKAGRRKINVDISLLGGMMHTRNYFVIPKKRNHAFNDANLHQSLPGFGIMLGFSNPASDEKTNLQVGLFLVQYEYKGFASIMDGVLTNNHTIEMDYTEVLVPIGVKHSFIRRHLSPYIGGGGLFVFNAGRKEKWVWEEVGVLGPTVRKTPEKFMKSGQVGLWFNGGLELPVWSKLSVITELGFHYTNGLVNIKTSDNQVSRSDKITAQILVGLKF